MRTALALVALLLAAGCLAEPAAPDPGTTPTPRPSPTPPTQVTRPPEPGEPAGSLVEANTRFAFDLLRTLAAEAPGENLVMSPLSVSLALQMLYAGANGATEDAMRDALRLGNTTEPLDADVRALLHDLLSGDPNVTLDVANALWIDEDFAPRVDEAYTARIRDSYLGDAKLRDFRAPATVDDVNAWASEKTRGKIPKVLDRISEEEVLLLMNAVYFKGAWTTSFNATCTHDADFIRADGSNVTVAMMCNGKNITWAPGDGGERIARIPYGDGRFAFYAILPPSNRTLDDFVVGWNGSGLDDVRRGHVEFEMPRFKLRTTALDLEPALTHLGMGVAFTDGADLTGIAPSLFVSRVQHDAMMEVDENGTVAAAVTTVGVGVTSLPPPPERIVLDRPFAVVVRDDTTGSVLFFGIVHDPVA